MKTGKPKATSCFLLVIVFVMLLASCSDGSGTETNSGTSAPPATTAPNAPTNVKAEAKSSTSILVSWSSVSGASSYDVYFETNASPLSKITNVTGTSYTHIELKPSTNYKYYVTAINSAGTSDFSSPASVTTPGGQKPATPSKVTAAFDSSTGSIRISWEKLSDTISYEVHYAIGSSSSDKNFAGSITTPPYNHNKDLQPNTTYYYFVKAINDAGESDFSSPVSAKTPATPATPPTAPTEVTADAQSSTSIRVTWKAVSNEASYEVHYTVGTSSSKLLASDYITGSSYTHSGLQSDTTYTYYIKAKNNAGESGFSPPASAKTLPTKPAAPTGVIAEAQSSSRIEVTWEKVSNATSYEVHYTVGTSSIKRSASDNVTGSSYTHSGLESDTTYTYYIIAKNSAGTTSDFSLAVSAKTWSIIPLPPTGVTASASSPNSIQVSWGKVSNATSYEVHYTVGTSSTKITANNNVTSLPYTHSGLQPNTTYTYYIKAKNSAGPSDFSSSAAATTPPDPTPPITKLSAPTGVKATAGQGMKIVVSWNPVSGAVSYNVYYEIGSSTGKTKVTNNRSPETTSYTHTMLQSGTLYRYYITAIDSYGNESDFSSPASATASRNP